MWMRKLAYRGIEDQVLQHLQQLPGQWKLVSRMDTGRSPNIVGKDVHEINLSYEGRGVKMPYDKFEVVVWLQVGGQAEPGTRRFNLQTGHPDVAFEVLVLTPQNRNDPDSHLKDIASTDTERHTPREVAEYVMSVIDGYRDDDNNEQDIDQGPTPTPEFAPVGIPNL
jgi:hypothetical protein